MIISVCVRVHVRFFGEDLYGLRTVPGHGELEEVWKRRRVGVAGGEAEEVFQEVIKESTGEESVFVEANEIDSLRAYLSK